MTFDHSADLPALVVGLALAFLDAAATFMVVRGIDALFRRQWRMAVVALWGVLLFLAYVVAISGAAYLLGPGRFHDGAEAGARARALGQTISTLMEISVWGLPFGVINGLFAGVRARRGAG